MGQAKHWMCTGVWVGLLACACGVACTPGELDEKQEKYLRKEIGKRYPAPKPQADAANVPEVQPGNNDAGVEPDESSTGATSTVTSTGPSATESSDMTSEPEDVGADAGGGGGAELPDCLQEMFTTTCAGAACHTGGIFMPNFADDSLFELLTTTGSTCSTRLSDLYIDLENPEDSYILQKVNGDGFCGFPMPPPGEGEVSAAELECLEGWLESL